MTLVPLTAWIFVVPIPQLQETLRPRTTIIRTWLALVLVWQFLHAYPVMGSQTGWAVVLWPVLLGIGLHESGRWLVRFAPRRVHWIRSAGLSMVATVACSANLMVLGVNARDYYNHAVPLELPGTNHLRALSIQTTAMRIATRNAVLHGDQLFSMPGMFSPNLWTGLPAPTLANTTVWFKLLNESQQDETVAAMRRAQHPVVLVQPGVIEHHRELHPIPEGSLERFIKNEFEPLLSVPPYDLWMRPGPPRLKLDMAELYITGHADSDHAAMISVATSILPGESIASISLHRFTPQGSEFVTRWNQDSCQANYFPTNRQGAPRDAMRSISTWPFELEGLNQLNIFITESVDWGDVIHLWLVFENADGNRIGEARFVDNPAKDQRPPTR